MPEEIRGLNVKFDADFSEFKKNLKDADKDINSTQKQLKSLQESLKLEWDPKKFSQAQQQAQKALQATEEKASLLRRRLQEIEAAGVTDKNRDEYNYLMEQLDKTDLSALKLRKQIEDLDDIRLNNLTKQVDKLESKLESAAKKTRGLSLAAAGAVAGLTAMIVTSVSNAAALDDLSQRSGISAEKLQELQYVTMQVGIETETLSRALIKARSAYADLGTGNINKQTEALTALGISYENLSQDEVFDAVIDSLSRIEDETLRVAYANEIFGDRIANDLIPLLSAGGDALQELKDEFHGFDSLTNEQVSAMAEMDDELNRMKQEFSYLALQMSSDLLPVFADFVAILREDVIPMLRGIIDWFTGLDEGTQKFIITLLMLIAVLSPVFSLLANGTKVISGVIQFIGKMDDATKQSAKNWAIMGAAIFSVFSLISNWSQLSAVEKILYSLATAALVAAAAVSVFHASWSLGIAVGAIVAGISAIMGEINSVEKDLGLGGSPSGTIGMGTYSIPEYTIPQSSPQSSVTNNDNTYTDNSNITINIEKNEYMTEDDIIRAVNRGLKQAKQSRV